ncbi:MAG: hypothetical protein ACE5FL_02200 [Myxococcota bacterium]
MKYLATILCLAAVTAVPGTAFTKETGDPEPFVLEIRVKGRHVSYRDAELRPLATKQMANTKGTKTRPGAVLSAIVAKAMGGSIPELMQLVIIGEDRAVVLEGSHLDHLDELVLKFGAQHPALVPASDAAYERLKAVMSKPRLKRPETIYVFPKAISLPWPLDDASSRPPGRPIRAAAAVPSAG